MKTITYIILVTITLIACKFNNVRTNGITNGICKIITNEYIEEFGVMIDGKKENIWTTYNLKTNDTIQKVYKNDLIISSNLNIPLTIYTDTILKYSCIIPSKWNYSFNNEKQNILLYGNDSKSKLTFKSNYNIIYVKINNDKISTTQILEETKKEAKNYLSQYEVIKQTNELIEIIGNKNENRLHIITKVLYISNNEYILLSCFLDENDERTKIILFNTMISSLTKIQ